MSTEPIRLLGPDDVPEFLDLTAHDPAVNVFAAYRSRVTNLDPTWLGGEVWGRFDGRELVSACHFGANLVPVGCDAEEVLAYRQVAIGRRRSIATLVGPVEPVAALWRCIEPQWRRSPREERWEQPHLVIDHAPEVEPDPEVRVTDMTDLDALYPACVAMYTEEVGISPESGGGKNFYRARVQHLISRDWSFARFDDDGRVVFKAEVACATPWAAQIQGVWVRPDRRGEGLAAAGMAAVVAHVQADIAPLVSLYVNDWNAAARATYDRVGFEQTATFATVMF